MYHELCCDCVDDRLGDHCESHFEAASEGESFTCKPTKVTETQDAFYLQDAEGWDIASVPKTSSWVRRAENDDLPTFDRHNGAMAYARP